MQSPPLAYLRTSAFRFSSAHNQIIPIFFFFVLLTSVAAGQNASQSLPTSDSSTPTAAVPSLPAIDPNQLVLESIQQLVWGPSYSCNVRQISYHGDVQLVAEGEYHQAGEGTGQIKMAVAMTAGDIHSQFVQISDGRLLWTAIGDKEPPRRVYLDRVRQSLGSMARNPAGHPEAALYLAIGGHAEMMRSLYSRYRWYKVYTGIDSKGKQVWQLVGIIRKEPPTTIARTKIDSLFVADSLHADVPVEVRLTLGREGKLNLYPLKVEYFRREKNKAGAPGKLIPVSIVEIDELVTRIPITKEMFQYKVRDDADQIVDETNDYLPVVPIAEASGNLKR